MIQRQSGGVDESEPMAEGPKNLPATNKGLSTLQKLLERALRSLFISVVLALASWAGLSVRMSDRVAAQEIPSSGSTTADASPSASHATASDPQAPASADYQLEDNWSDEEWGEEEEEAGVGRSFFFKELVLSGFYSSEGVVGVPPDHMCEKHLEATPRPPGNYAAVDFVKTFKSSSAVNKWLLPRILPLSAVDLHPRLLFDRMQRSDSPRRVKFAPQDLWLRFNPAGLDRLMLRFGQFVIPYGVNPILAPRQRFILPLEATDLGLKWDWGLGLKGPIGGYDWEMAATIGTGEALHSTNFFAECGRSSGLLTGRIGTPTYWDLQYGLSFLYGELPMIRAATLMNDMVISRARVGLDVFYKHGTYLMATAQVTYGQDGFDEDHIMTTDVLGYRAGFDWVVPGHLDWRFAGQFESVIRNLDMSGTDDTAVILEVIYSLTTSVSMMADYRRELNRSMGKENSALYLTFIYYSR